MVYDAIIIGGGVSGLMAAYHLALLNRRVLVVERGRQFYERQHDKPFDVANGIGGSGLFSDGKLSLFPSATQLWKLEKNTLEIAYNSVDAFLQPFGVELPVFSEKWCLATADDSLSAEKKYESMILSKDQRTMIAFKLIQTIGPSNIAANTEIVRLVKRDNIFELEGISESGKVMYRSHTVILAGGKHQFDAMFPNMTGVQCDCYERYEIGFRVECPNDQFDFYDSEQADVKLIEKSGQYEIRTFCCCKSGLVLESKSDGFASHNGSSSDFEKTGYSNIGFIVTIPKEYINETLVDELKNRDTETIPLADFMEERKIVISEEVDAKIRSFIKAKFPRMAQSSEGLVYTPEFERFGMFPVLGDQLQLGMSGIWLAGDSGGLFRGLLPSFVSGVFVANQVDGFLADFEHELMRQFHIKTSANNCRKVVFTAQSKQWFFCRNAVCEYVFKNDCIPVNPFRIFGYFLDDRVDRGLVRNGNNEMIARCDELWVFGPISDGVLFEIFSCIRQGKPVRFFSIATTANEIREIPIDETTFEPEVHSHKVKKEDLKKLIEFGGGIEMVNQLKLF